MSSPVLDKNGRAMRLAAMVQTTPSTTMPKSVRVCSDPDSAIQVAQFIVAEMKTNPFCAEGLRIAEYNRFDQQEEVRRWRALPWYSRLGGMPDIQSQARAAKSAAYTLWAERVGPGRPWDHKPRIATLMKRQGLFNKGWHKYAQYEYFYDIWSNIHYGYVGLAIGFTAAELINGAGLAQIGDDAVHLRRGQHHAENGPWPASADDVQDHTSIQLGIDMYQVKKPQALTVDFILQQISAVQMPWGLPPQGLHAKEEHQCGRMR